MKTVILKQSEIPLIKCPHLRLTKNVELFNIIFKMARLKIKVSNTADLIKILETFKHFSPQQLNYLRVWFTDKIFYIKNEQLKCSYIDKIDINEYYEWLKEFNRVCKLSKIHRTDVLVQYIHQDKFFFYMSRFEKKCPIPIYWTNNSIGLTIQDYFLYLRMLDLYYKEEQEVIYEIKLQKDLKIGINKLRNFLRKFTKFNIIECRRERVVKIIIDNIMTKDEVRKFLSESNKETYKITLKSFES